MSTILKGFVTKKLQPKEGDGWTKETFILKKFDDGKEVFCTVFDSDGKESLFDPSIVGQDVTFEAEWNGKYKNYSVKSKIETYEHDLPEQTEAVGKGEPAPAAVAPRRRGRKPGTAKVTSQVEATVPVTSGDVFSEIGKSKGTEVSEAAEIVELNITEARLVAKNLELKPTSDDALITLADMIGRTKIALRIEAGKDRRTTQWKGRK